MAEGDISFFTFFLIWLFLGVPTANKGFTIFQEEFINFDKAEKKKIVNDSSKQIPLDLKYYEAKILKTASKFNGKVTPAELAAELKLSKDSARQLLDRMAEQDSASLHVTDSGDVFYKIFGFDVDKNESEAF
ncbi:MAG: hypothetical protein CVV64_13160 [Candidatus Wallbacteria bacterium HGW-Wallbacteria-1]|uniref:Uncharacterized protein n=1 Tax=Candidatus Wallbacteria bacterium HGW-Wallbacteria-1 TaxID=2013854 RepID=A0A2N1PN37_9BACT|nr:MAG: hypothetical protein CVV64_13160 [Candidatus Wallbacteria bacterium HGW-Wallbacteria-1]